MDKRERDLKIRTLVHDIKNKIGIMSGYAQSNYLMQKDFDIPSMPQSEILKHYLRALEDCRGIHNNSQLADTLLMELKGIIYKELGIDNSKPLPKKEGL